METYFVLGGTQVDIVVKCDDDRVTSVIEAKWKGESIDVSECLKYAQAVIHKRIEVPNATWVVRHFLALSNGASNSAVIEAKKLGVKIISLKDLFTS